MVKAKDLEKVKTLEDLSISIIYSRWSDEQVQPMSYAQILATFKRR